MFTDKKRILICSLIALSSGFFCAFIGGQTAMMTHNRQCQQHKFWGGNLACSLVKTPTAFFQGTTTGLWVGTVLGAFIGGTFTRK